MMQSTHTNRINSGMGHCALPKRQLQTDLGCALTVPGAAISPCADYVAMCPQGSRLQPRRITSVPTQVEIRPQTQQVSWMCVCCI